MTQPEKPRPPRYPWTEPHWQAANEGRLLIQRCESCRTHIFYPRIACPQCGSDQVGWVEASGRARVYTFSVVRNNAPSAFLADMPYVVAIVQLEEGPRMFTRIVGCPPEEVRCEMPVKVAFERVDEALSLPVFQPA